MNLAAEGLFRLGAVSVDPAGLQFAWPGGGATVQRRAMQVFLQLVRADGAVVTRDALIEHCWASRAVSDDSINRVIHLLRQVARQSGGAFSILTIARVGYRLSAFAETAHAGLEPLLAVLPFDNLTGDPALDYFSEGLSEEILFTVARRAALKVVGRSSSFSLRGSEKSAGRVREMLGATHLLDGSVRRSGDRVRINAELVDCERRLTLWSERFERPLADAFAVEDEIAAAVAAALKLACAPVVRAEPIDPIAFDFYLKARHRDFEWSLPQIGLLEQATARAPRFVQAWALLAYGRALALRWVMRGEEFTRGHAAVAHAARQALAIDPKSALAHLALAMIEPICGRWKAHRAIVDQALAAEPNESIVLMHAAGVRDVVGLQRLALDFAARAYAVDPRLTGFYYADLLAATGHPEEATALFDRDLERWPNAYFLNTNALRFAIAAADWRRSERLLARMPAWMAATPIVKTCAELMAELRDWTAARAQTALARLEDRVEAGGSMSFASAAILCDRGQADAVYGLIDRASFVHLFSAEECLEPEDLGLNVLFSPGAAAMRRDRRFVRLCARLGLVDHWRSTGEWPDFAREVTAAYDLRGEVDRLA